MEPEAVLAGHRRALCVHEPTARQRNQCAADRRPLVVGRHCLHGRPPEVPPDDRGAVEHSSLAGGQAVDAATAIDTSSVGGSGSSTSSAAKTTSCSRNSGLPSAISTAAPTTLSGKPARSGSNSTSVRASVARDRPERDRVVAPLGPRLEQLGPRDAEQQERPCRPAEQVLDEVEQVGRCPVQILEQDDQRPVACRHLEQPAKRPEGVARLGERSLAQRHEDASGIGLVRKHVVERLELFEDVAERQQARAVAVRPARPDSVRALLSACERNALGEPRLADPRLAEQDDATRGSAPLHLRERSVERVELGDASDDRRVQVARERLRSRIEPQHAISRARLVRDDVDRRRHDPQRLGPSSRSPGGSLREQALTPSS